MSTVVFKDGLRIWVNSREPQHKGRPHCHVEKGSAHASIDLLTFEVMASNGEFTRSDMAKILQFVQDFHDDLLGKWSEYHGKE